jgi:hypothetical protein
MLTRREALTRVSILMGGTILGAQAFLSSCNSSEGGAKGKLLSADEIALMDEIGETIIPTTASSPGAKAVAIGSFADMMAKDCYTEEDQKTFKKGFATLEEKAKKDLGTSFLKATPAQRKQLLNALDQEQRDYYKRLEQQKQTGENGADKAPNATIAKQERPEPHYFRQMKEITLLGYFTSEPGCTKALRYVETPGRFDGAMPYKKGDRAWA